MTKEATSHRAAFFELMEKTVSSPAPVGWFGASSCSLWTRARSGALSPGSISEEKRSTGNRIHRSWKQKRVAERGERGEIDEMWNEWRQRERELFFFLVSGKSLVTTLCHRTALPLS